MLINLFIILFRLMFQPKRVWMSLAKENTSNNESFYKSYLYPLIGLIALLSFIGVIVRLSKFDVSLALQTMLIFLVVYMLSFLVGSYLVSELWLKKKFGKRAKIISERFIAYSSAWIFFIGMIIAVKQDWLWLAPFMLLSIITIISGIKYYINVLDGNTE